MSKIHFIGGEKGGVGKSVFSRVLSQYFLDNGRKYIGLDADQSHPTLSRYYGEFTDSINLDEFESIDHIMEAAIENDCDVLVDLPAQSQRFLDVWIDENDVLDMCKELNITLVYWYIVDDGRDSADLLAKFIEKYHGALHLAVVKNHVRGDDFSQVEAIPALSDVLSTVDQIDLPALHNGTMHKIDKLNFSFWAAANINDKGSDHLSIMERQRAKVWMKKTYAMIEGVLALVKG